MSLKQLMPWNRGLVRHPEQDPFMAWQQELSRTFDSLFEGKDWLMGPSDLAGLHPKLDISETDTEVHVTAELPGMAEQDIDVELTDEFLKIRGEKKDERETQDRHFHRTERTFGRFERMIPLPGKVLRDGVTATFKQGVLNVVLPKAEANQVHQKVTVQAG
ncbi:Hsp20 family protein [bacterium]|nr:Hsp20 family protein [bacterium]